MHAWIYEPGYPLATTSFDDKSDDQSHIVTVKFVSIIIIIKYLL